MTSWSPGEAGGAFAGVIAALAVVGKGIAWIVNWRGQHNDTREERLNKWEASLRRREMEARDVLEHRLAALETNVTRLRRKVIALRGSLIEVTLELRVLDPQSGALERATVLLRDAFPPEFDVPEDIGGLVGRLDDEGGSDDAA